MNVDLRNGFEDWSLGGSFDDDPALYSLVKCSVYDIFFFFGSSGEQLVLVVLFLHSK